jgi:hypothetical protein
MNIKEFGKIVCREIGGVLGDEYTINISEYPKNNGIVKRGLTILKPHENISPCIYLDNFYNCYEEGDLTMEEIVDEIIRTYKKNPSISNWDTTIFTDYNKAKKRLCFHLINGEKNQELLKSIPHRKFLDLALIYRVEFPCELMNGIGSIQVKNEHAALWGVSEEELFSQAKENMERQNESMLENLEELLLRNYEEIPQDSEFNIPMYVLSNKNRNHGASQIFDENIMREAADILGEDFLILPSSVHEVILVPAVDEEDQLEQMRKTVQEVNDTQVALNAILSYHVYRYNCQTGKIAIAA